MALVHDHQIKRQQLQLVSLLIFYCFFSIHLSTLRTAPSTNASSLWQLTTSLYLLGKHYTTGSAATLAVSFVRRSLWSIKDWRHLFNHFDVQWLAIHFGTATGLQMISLDIGGCERIFFISLLAAELGSRERTMIFLMMYLFETKKMDS